MNIEAIHSYARERGLSIKDASQTFMQVIVLKNLSAPGAHLMGGTALVLGHGNPRFSEDVDLSQVPDPKALRPGLMRAAAELERWLGSPIALTPPKAGGRTWRLTCRLGRAEALQLHVDSQPYPAQTTHPIIVQFPSIPPFVCEAIALDEIMAEKMLAVAYRRYLGGRDIFDLWFHWLRSDDWISRLAAIRDHLEKKLKDRSLSMPEFRRCLSGRLSPIGSLDRVREEWRRYLPSNFQRPSIEKTILAACERLPETFQ